jgi:hypothetical protein
MSRPKFEYKILDAPFAISDSPLACHENPNIFTAAQWERRLNEIGEDGWDFFRYDYGKWFFRRIKDE